MFTVGDFLELPEVGDARVVGGGRALPDREIRWVTAAEWPVEDSVAPDELVLASGVSCDAEMLAQLVREVAASGAAAFCLGVGCGRYFEEIPEATRSLGDDLGLPLVELAWEIRFADLMRAVIGRLGAIGGAEHADALRRTFVDLVVEGNGLESIVQTLGGLIERSVVVLGAELTPLAGAPRDRSLAHVAERARELDFQEARMLASRLSARHPRHIADLSALGLPPAYAIAATSDRRSLAFVLALDGQGGALSPTEHEALRQAAVAVALVELRRRAAEEAVAGTREEFLRELANRRLSSEDAAARAAALQLNLRAAHAMLVVSPRRRTARVAPATAEVELRDALARLARDASADLLLGEVGDAIVALVAAQQGDAAAAFVDGVRSAATSLDAAIAICATPFPLGELADRYEEARETLALGRASLGECFAAAPEEVAPFRLLARLADDGQARHAAEEILAPLLEYDQATSRDLLGTLSVFFDESCNKSATARRLFLNRHSLMYRLEKIEALTGYRLDEATERLLLELSVRLHCFPHNGQNGSAGASPRAAARTG